MMKVQAGAWNPDLVSFQEISGTDVDGYYVGVVRRDSVAAAEVEQRRLYTELCVSNWVLRREAARRMTRGEPLST
ncbi:MAG: hypothetical protein FJX77_03795 [Armatimonadetes bacterium]|nr:hypothetical protein [Armatimonadota bacterium]